MPQQNAELVREGIAALNESYGTRDIQPWRRHVEKAFDPEVVLEPGEHTFTEGEWRGHEGAVGFVANQMEVLEDMWIEVDEYTEVDEACLIVAISFGGRARHTRIEVDLHPTHVLRLRDGKVLRWQIFQDRDQALEASGLAE